MVIDNNKKHGHEGRVVLINPGICGSRPFSQNEVGMFPNNAVQILGTILRHDLKAKLKYLIIYFLYKLSVLRFKREFYSLNFEQRLMRLFRKST